MVYLNGAPGPTQILAPAYAGPQGQYDGLDQVNLDHQSPGFTVPAGREVYVGSQRGWFRFERRAILCSIGGGKLNPTAARALRPLAEATASRSDEERPLGKYLH